MNETGLGHHIVNKGQSSNWSSSQSVCILCAGPAHDSKKRGERLLGARGGMTGVVSKMGRIWTWRNPKIAELWQPGQQQCVLRATTEGPRWTQHKVEDDEAENIQHTDLGAVLKQRPLSWFSARRVR